MLLAHLTHQEMVGRLGLRRVMQKVQAIRHTVLGADLRHDRLLGHGFCLVEAVVVVVLDLTKERLVGFENATTSAELRHESLPVGRSRVVQRSRMAAERRHELLA